MRIPNLRYSAKRVLTEEHLDRPCNIESSWTINPKLVIAMPYNHDEVVASMTEFYNFLTTHLHFNPSELKTPPPAGWAHISPPLFPHQSKSNTVIDLLHHLPYLPGGNTQEKWIYDHTVCADYTDKRIELGVELSVEEVAESCPWEKLQDPSRQEHIVALGTPETVSAQHL
jgi:hypothetical protein